MLTHGPTDPYVAARKAYLEVQGKFLQLLEAMNATDDQRRMAREWWYRTFGDGR